MTDGIALIAKDESHNRRLKSLAKLKGSLLPWFATSDLYKYEKQIDVIEELSEPFNLNPKHIPQIVDIETF